jgi:hypothetical protein
MARIPRNMVPGQSLPVIRHGNSLHTDFFYEISSHHDDELLPAAADNYAGAVPQPLPASER